MMPRGTNEGISHVTVPLSVTVTQPGMTVFDISGSGNRVGAALQVRYQLRLGTLDHPEVTVQVTSS